MENFATYHIANLQNDALWEGQGCKFDAFPQSIILKISDMVYAIDFETILSDTGLSHNDGLVLNPLITVSFVFVDRFQEG